MFGGKPLEFHYFMAVFDEAVEKKIEDTHGNLIHLIKYTTGEVKNGHKLHTTSYKGRI